MEEPTAKENYATETGSVAKAGIGAAPDKETGSGTEAATQDQIQALFRSAVATDPSLTLLRGFKVDFSGNQNFHKIYLAVRCHCAAAALLSVEVALDKTLPQVEQAMPSLLENLRMKALHFTNMPCSSHALLSKGSLK